MTITIKKVRNYVLLGTIISASTTAPAQAGSLKNLNSNHDLTKASDNQASTDSKDVLVEKLKCKEADSCISFPEFDLDGEFNKNDNSFFKKVRRTEPIQAANTTQVKTVNRRKHIIHNTEFAGLETEELYTNVYFSAASKRKKVPEPSALLGLIAFFLLAAKRQTAKNSQTLVE